MLRLIVILLTKIALAQIRGEGNNLTFVFTPIATLQPYNDTSSSYNTDPYFYRNIQHTNSCIYTLQSNNIVQVYSHTNPPQLLQTFSNYSFIDDPTYTFVSLSVNSQNLLILTSYIKERLQHLLFRIDSNGIVSFQNITGNSILETAPSKVFIRNQFIYSYVSLNKNKDIVHIVNIITNSSYQTELQDSNCSIAVTPDQQKALVWTRNTKIYVYSISDNFTLQHIYEQNITNLKDKTNAIKFSSDSSLALIQTDNKNPIRIIYLTDFSTMINFNSFGSIVSVSFLDEDNRFVLIYAKSQSKIYDLQENNLIYLDGSFSGNTLSISTESELFDEGTSSVIMFQITIQEASASLPDKNQSSTAGAEQPRIDTRNFYIELNLSETQNQTIRQIGKVISNVNSAINSAFSIIFSSPAACFFLSFFNYFTLSSLYLLLNMQIPYSVFYYLSLLYASCSSNVLTQLSINLQVQPLSADRVTDARPIYFNVSSDIYSGNFTSMLLFGLNCLLYEGLILVSSRLSKQLRKTLTHLRVQVYWGMIVSNMIGFILPWKYSFQGGVIDFSSKINTAMQYLLLCIIPFLVLANLLHEWDEAKKSKNEHKFKAALRQWWSGFQNCIYPIFLLLQSPLYFMGVIGVCNLISLYNSFYSPKNKVLSVLKAVYPVLFHCYFIVFLRSQDNLVLVIASISCLATFLVGSIHHLLETAYVILKFIYKIVKHLCKTNQILPKNLKLLKNQKNIFQIENPSSKNSKVGEILAIAEAQMQIKSINPSPLGSSKIVGVLFPPEGLRKKKVKFTTDCRHDDSIKMQMTSKINKTEVTVD